MAFSPFELPSNHKILVKWGATPNMAIACADSSNWRYIWNNDSRKNIYVHTSDGTSYNNYNISYTPTSNTEYIIECDNNTIKLYSETTLLGTYTTYDPSSLTRYLRFSVANQNISNVSYIKVKPL